MFTAKECLVEGPMGAGPSLYFILHVTSPSTGLGPPRGKGTPGVGPAASLGAWAISPEDRERCQGRDFHDRDYDRGQSPFPL